MRWLSRDPLGEAAGAGQGTNLYGYVLGDPLGTTDPSGMRCWPKWLDDNPILEALGLMLALGGPEDPLADALALAPFYDEAAAVAAEVAEGIGAEAADLVSSSVGEGTAAEGSPSINPGDVAGKTPAEIDSLAQNSGLVPRGPDPMNGRGAYIDPVTGEQRILSHPNADPPHAHVNDPFGTRLDINGNPVEPESPEAHLPIGN